MIEFLIKSTVSLGLLLAVYHLFLETEKIHVFNRFYLLAALVFSFSIPFLTIEIINEIPVKATAAKIYTTGPKQAAIAPTGSLLFLQLIYGVITLALFVRFLRNIFQFVLAEKSAKSVRFHNAKLVLVSKKTLPHTFGNHIFVNEKDYVNHAIANELLAHELVHVKQKHTIDILFVELLKTIMWFNPLLLLYKNAIQLNHEFLADQNVVLSFRNVSSYQNLLLSNAARPPALPLASRLNYQLTKKRLLMMTKTTSEKTAVFKKFAVLPIFIGLFYFSCFETIAQVKPTQTVTKQQPFKQKNATVPLQVDSEANNATANTDRKLEPIVQPDQNTVQDSIYNVSELTEKPEFPGGMTEFYNFVAQNYKLPKTFSGNAKVFVTFIVEKDGSLSNFRSLRDAGNGTSAEALRVLALSPKWTPGKNNGQLVRCMFALPITLTQQ